jgi:selenocysteine lyase/cysteine desulfurase
MLIFANQYPMCRAALDFYNSRAEEAEAVTLVAADAPTCRVTPVVFTLTASLLADETALVDAIVETAKSAGVQFFMVDHVCWGPAFVFPIAEICRRLRRELGDIVIIIDGAHAVGQIDLKPLFEENEAHRNDSNNSGGVPLFDAYFSNFHKWLQAPRHCCFMFCDQRLQRFLHPNIVDNFYRGHCQDDVNGSLQHEFFWCGTKDFSNFLVIPDLLEFRDKVLGGERRIMEHNHQLVVEGARRVAEIWGTEVLLDDPRRIGAMSCVRVPVSDPKISEQLLMELLKTTDSFAPPMTFHGVPYVRLSAQVYNELSDFEHLARSFLALLASKSSHSS